MPFATLRGIIGSDILAQRPDWKVIDNPFPPDDPIVAAAGAPARCRALPCADGGPRAAMSGSGGGAISSRIAHASATSVATVERIYDGNLLLDETLAPATIPAFYIGAVAVAPRGAWPMRLDGSRGHRASARVPGAGRDRGRVSAAISTAMSMPAAPPERAVRPEEVLIETVRRLLAGARHVAVGANSPIPAAAAFLEQRLRGGTPLVSLQQSPEHNLFTDGGRELFDAAGQGRIDVFFFSGAEIDGDGNINLVAIGDYARPKVALRRLLRLGLSLFRRAAHHPLPHRAFAPHAGREGRVRQRAGDQPAQRVAARRARSRW